MGHCLFEEYLQGALCHCSDWLAPSQQLRLFNVFKSDVPWSQPSVRMFGREIPSPRLAAWYGDPGARYTYSGVTYEPLPWTTESMKLKCQIEEACGFLFNSVLLNYYRDGNDSMGWHCDDEPELGDAPVIASLSLGCTRRFRLQHRRCKGVRIELSLEPGSLLLMLPPLQREWRHSVPKERTVDDARINLTFRMLH